MTRKEELVQKLNAGAESSLRFFTDLDDDQLALKVYTDGLQWTAGQVLAHLIGIEQSMHRLFESMLQGGPGSPRNFDIERFNRSQTKKLAGLSKSEMLERLAAVRAKTVAMVENMSEADLDREGWHAYHGHGRLERFIRWAYEHAAMHIADIRAACE